MDFPYNPDFGYEVKPDYNVIADTFENNVKQTRLKTSQKLRLYTLPFSNRSSTEITAVNSWFDSTVGTLHTFTVNIEGVSILGEFVKGSYSYKRIAPNVYSYSFNFQEVVNAR